MSDEHFDVMRAVATAADLKTENAALKARIAELEARLHYIDERKGECDCGLAWQALESGE